MTIAATDPVSLLPSEIAVQIFSNLDSRSLCRSCRVSSRWNAFIDCNIPWAVIAKKMFKDNSCHFPNARDFLRKLEAQKLKSNDEIVACVQNFANKVHFHQSGSFKCILKEGPSSKMITITINDLLSKNPDRFDIKEDYFAEHELADGQLKNPALEDYSSSRWIDEHFSQDLYGNRVRFFIQPSFGAYKSTFSFPSLKHHQVNLGLNTEMERKINNILRATIDRISERAVITNVVKFFIIILAMALTLDAITKKEPKIG